MIITEQSLREYRILVVEDEYMLANELVLELGDAGATVIGPAPTIERALALLDGGSPPDGAILDVNLGGVMVFPLADALIDRGVPLVFTTGYDPASLPDRYANFAICEKPINVARITGALFKAIRS